MARPELGTKRVCGTCGTKFYDLSKDPILCPKCGTVFVMSIPLIASAMPAAKTALIDDAVLELIDPSAELISLEDLEVEGDDKDSVDATEDDTFLEEEDEDTNVADFIDGDLENEDDQ